MTKGVNLHQGPPWRQSLMFKAKEVFVRRINNLDVGIKILDENGQELDLHIPRDIAHDLIPQIYVALDVNGVNKPEDMH